MAEQFYFQANHINKIYPGVKALDEEIFCNENDLSAAVLALVLLFVVTFADVYKRQF